MLDVQVGVRNSASCGDLGVRFDPGDEGRLETWRALELAYKRGLVRAIGVSDFSLEQLRALVEKAIVKPAVLQYVRNVAFHDAALE